MANGPSQPTETATQRPDIVDQLAGLEAGSPLYELRHQRADVARYTQGSYHELLEPQDLAGVSRIERESIALRAATLAGSERVAEHHRAQLRALGVSDDISAVEQFPNGAALPERLALILRHVDLLTLEPRAATLEAIQALQAGGLSARDIVIVSQLIAFLSFEVRVLAGLRALGEAS
jgi:CMD domain protein